MYAGGDSKFLARSARLRFRLGEQGIMQQRGGLSGDGVKQLLIDFTQVSRAYLAIEIKKPQQFGMLVFCIAPAQRNAVDAANLIHHHARPG